MPYDPRSIEPKWQKYWADNHTFRARIDPLTAQDNLRSLEIELRGWSGGAPRLEATDARVLSERRGAARATLGTQCCHVR